MTMKELREKLHKEIDKLNAKYETIPENEIVERANVLGQINHIVWGNLI